jgi:hypothetical protein
LKSLKHCATEDGGFEFKSLAFGSYLLQRCCIYGGPENPSRPLKYLMCSFRITALNLISVAIALVVVTNLLPFGAWASGEMAQQQAPQSPSAREVGSITAIQGNTIKLKTDAGNDLNVVVRESTRMARVEPGQKDLKGATAIQLKDLQPGDRVLVHGQAGPDCKTITILATRIVVMKQSDLAAKQQREREDWQKRSIGGLVSTVDPPAGTVTISVSFPGGTKKVVIHVAKSTIVRRYAPDSVKFDDAKVSTLDQIKPDDQLRARGTRGPGGSEFAAEEIVSGSFRNIAGTISYVDAATNSVSVMDLIAKKPVVVKISTESQVRKLPPEIAQRVAMRLNAPAAGHGDARPSSGPPSGPGVATPGRNAAPGGQRAGGGAGGDLNQLLSRLPTATVDDLRIGNAVMIVSTKGARSDEATAITLLGGVEPIMEALARGGQSFKILSPWNLGGDAGEAGGEGP